MALKAHLEPKPDSPSHAGSGASDASVEVRHQARRALRLETSGALPTGAQSNVTVHNLSPAGLLIETEMRLDVGDMLAIDMPDLGPVGAEIVWQSDDLYGCAFEQALGEAALAAAQLRGQAVTGSPSPGAPTSAPAQALSAPSGPGALPIADPLGARINRLRRERSLTLAQVAAALGVSKPTVWAWEKGKARPLPERLDAIAEVLGVSVSELSDRGAQGEAGALIEDCRMQLAACLGTDPRNIRIMIEV